MAFGKDSAIVTKLNFNLIIKSRYLILQISLINNPVVNPASALINSDVIPQLGLCKKPRTNYQS